MEAKGWWDLTYIWLKQTHPCPHLLMVLPPSSQSYPKPTESSGLPQLLFTSLPPPGTWVPLKRGLFNGLKEDKMDHKVTKSHVESASPPGGLRAREGQRTPPAKGGGRGTGHNLPLPTADITNGAERAWMWLLISQHIS